MATFIALTPAFKKDQQLFVESSTISCIAEAKHEGTLYTEVSTKGGACIVVTETPKKVLQLITTTSKYVELPDGERPPLNFKRSEIFCFREKDETHTYLFLRGDDEAWPISAPVDKIKEILNA